MRKDKELNDPKSCLNKANFDEELFVLLARDPAAGATIRDWCDRRIILGKNKPSDPQIQDALDCANRMEAQREWVRK